MTERVKVLIGEKDGVELRYNEEIPLDADHVYLDPTGQDFVSDNLQNFAQESFNKTATSASPAFSLGRSGNNGAGTWLLRVGGVPSNKTGIPVSITGPIITNISAGNQDVSNFVIGIYEHEGDEVNLTLLTTVTITNKRSDDFEVSVPATKGRQIAAKIESGSAKGIGVDLQLQGSVT